MLGRIIPVKGEHVSTSFKGLIDEEASITIEAGSGEGDRWMVFG